jgi:hypothetical protein
MPRPMAGFRSQPLDQNLCAKLHCFNIKRQEMKEQIIVFAASILSAKLGNRCIIKSLIFISIYKQNKIHNPTTNGACSR